MHLSNLVLISLSILLFSCTAKAPIKSQNDEQRGLVRTQQQPVNVLEQRTALIIGNSDYEGVTPLKNPVNDASDLAEKLKTLNFKLINNQAILNANKREIKRAVRDFKQQLKKGGLGLFFYAGHGMQINGTNYLIPLDAEFASKADVENEAVKLNWILAELEDAKNPINFILLDACRDNPFRGFRGGNKGLAESRAPMGSLISFATSPGSVAADGLGRRNSPYTSGLLHALDQKGLEVLSMFKSVRRSVKNSTQNQQVPWESHSLTDDIYLNGKPVSKADQQEAVLQQLREIRAQQKQTEQQLQQAQKQQTQAQTSRQKKQADKALEQARATAKRIREQAQKMGVTIAPSVLEKSASNEFEKALLQQEQAFTLRKQKSQDSADYQKAKHTHTTEAYLHYLKNCRSPCAYSATAETAYQQLQAEQDKNAFKRAKKHNSIGSYEKYLKNCNRICAYETTAQTSLKVLIKLQQQAEQDASYYAQAKKVGTAPALAAYLSTCQLCLDSKHVKKDWQAATINQLPVKALLVLSEKSTQNLPRIAQRKIKAAVERKKTFGSFIDQQDGTVFDTKTNLQWMRCSLGQQWSGATCTGSAKEYSWQAALRAGKAYSYAGHSDWRVPTIKELISLIYCSNGKAPQYKKNGDSIKSEGGFGCDSDLNGDFASPTIRTRVFPNTLASFVWSSSPGADYSGSAWGVYFVNGYTSVKLRYNNVRVRLVRSGQ